MKLVACSDGHRIWIEDVDAPFSTEGRQIRCHFAVPPSGAWGMPKRAERRILAVATAMAEAFNKANSGDG